MAKMNTLFRKGYLLAGMMMAANMFVVNEVRAMNENENNIEEKLVEKDNEEINGGEGKEGEISGVQGFFNFVLTYENTINFIGGLALSGANNYFKWWDYNPGTYGELGCIGWRSKRLLDIFQFEVNLNGIRGISWSIPHIINFSRILTTQKTNEGKGTEGNKDTNSNAGLWVSFLIQGILPGFVSMPLTVHIAKIDFSISISLDSIIWAVIDKILELKYKKNLEKIKIKEGEELKDIKNVRPTDNTEDNIKAKENSETSETKAKEQLTEEIKKIKEEQKEKINN